MATKKNEKSADAGVADAVADAAAPVADVVVKNPVLIAQEITRFSGDKLDRKVVTYDPGVIASADIADKVVAQLNTTVRVKDDSKTARRYVIMSTDPTVRNAVPIIADAGAFERNTKRKALASIPPATRAVLGLPDPDAADAVIDAWTPRAAQENPTTVTA